MTNIGKITNINTLHSLINDKKKVIILMTTSNVPNITNNMLKQHMFKLANNNPDIVFLYYKILSFDDNTSRLVINTNVNVYPRMVLYYLHLDELRSVDNVDSIELVDYFIDYCNYYLFNSKDKLLHDKLNFLMKYITHFNYNFFHDLKERKQVSSNV
jgi:hypothetical protein